MIKKSVNGELYLITNDYHEYSNIELVSQKKYPLNIWTRTSPDHIPRTSSQWVATFAGARGIHIMTKSKLVLLVIFSNRLECISCFLTPIKFKS